MHSNKKFSFKSLFILSLVIFFTSVKLIAQPLVADGGISQTICEGGSTTIGGSPTAAYGTPGYTYSWLPATGLSSPSASNPIANPTTTTTYTISVTDAVLTVATATLTITVDPLPVITPAPSNIVVCNGSFLGSTSFSTVPGGASIVWTNSNPSIGIPASGVGFIPSFTAVNSGSTPIVATISVTPTLAGCSGPASNYTITVNPTPVVTATPASPAICSGDNTSISLTSNVAGTTFLWTSSMPSNITGESASGTTSTIGDVLICMGTATGSVIYVTTPSAAGCVGTALNTSVIVNPTPNITAFPSIYPATCSGGLVSVSFSSIISGTTYSWTSTESNTSGSALTGVGNISEFLTTTTTSPGSTTYLVTPMASGCAGIALSYVINVNPAPNANFSYSSSGCQYSPNAIPSFLPGATAGTFSSTAGLVFVSSATGEIDLTASTPGSYLITNTIPAGGGCPSANANNGFTITAYLDPTITNVNSICSSGAAFNYNAVTSGGTWSGTGITNASLGTFDPDSSGVGIFTITYSSPGPCINIDTTVISVTNADLHGKVTYSGGDLNSGTNNAVLFNYSSTFATFDTAQVSSIDALGYYHFTSVYPGNYLIEVFADTLVYPLAVPTYYDSEYLWDTALVKTHGCLTDTANVYVIEGIVPSGPGMFSGRVTEGLAFVRTPGDPIPGLDVKLGKNPGGAMVVNTQTDPTGNYSFSNIPINAAGEFYTVYIDIPGLGRDSAYNIVVTTTDFIFTQLDYEADSISVYPLFPSATNITNSETNSNQLSVYPNPTNASSTIEYTLTATNNIQLDVFDVLGKKVESLVNANQSAGNYKVNSAKLNAGIYFIKLKINDQTLTTRLAVID